MYTYIDESGSFVPNDGKSSKVSLVAALSLPGIQRNRIFRAFRRLKRQWGVGDTEIKGASIDELQASQFIDMLANFDVVLEFQGIDAARHSHDEIDRYQLRQASEILFGTESDIPPEGQAAFRVFIDAFAQLPHQLAIQFVLTIRLIDAVIRWSSTYFAHRIPTELSEFHWVIDAKHRNGNTLYEIVWPTLLPSILRRKFHYDPYLLMKGVDYSHMDVFLNDEGVPGTDRGGYLVENLINTGLSFQDSSRDIGLQLVDLVASIVSRAFNGNMRKSGWQKVGQLLIESGIGHGKFRPLISMFPPAKALRHETPEQKAVYGELLQRRRSLWMPGALEKIVASMKAEGS